MEKRPTMMLAQKKMQAPVPLVTIDSVTIQETARRRVPSGLLEIVIRQAVQELRFKLRAHLNFRRRRNHDAVLAYSAMFAEELEWINARQQWANWRTIPKNLSGRIPNEPLMALDLCCGVGHSTQVLACYLPEGSKILGLEFHDGFVERASRRSYTHLTGRRCDVAFRAQSVLATFRDTRGKAIAPSSVDLVNSSGAVGCHFDSKATAKLASEVRRTLRSGGIAMIDSGLPGTSKNTLIDIFTKAGFDVIGTAKSCVVDPYTQVCFKKR